MRVQDGARRRVEHVRDERRRATGLLPGVHGLEHEERRVGGVVLRWACCIGEAVRHQATVEVGEEALQHLARDRELPAGDEQPGERDHRVPAPVGEPGIAGDDRGRAIRTANEVRLGGALEPRPSLEDIASRRGGTRTGDGSGTLGAAKHCAERLEVEPRPGLDRCPQCLRATRRELQLEAPREQQVLAKIQSAVQLLQVLHVLVPLRCPVERAAAVGEAERGQPTIGLEADHPGSPHLALFEAGPRFGVPVGQRVVVAEGEQRLHPEPDGRRAGIANQHGLLALHHQDSALHLHATDRPGPYRALVEGEADQPRVAVRVERVRVLVDRERHRAVRGQHRLLQPGQGDDALDGRIQARHQQAVVPAGVRPGHRPHRETTGPVGEQPLQSRGARVERADLPGQLDGRGRRDGHRARGRRTAPEVSNTSDGQHRPPGAAR